MAVLVGKRSIKSALRMLKDQSQEAVQAYKDRQAYVKPSVRRRLKHEAALRRQASTRKPRYRVVALDGTVYTPDGDKPKRSKRPSTFVDLTVQKSRHH